VNVYGRKYNNMIGQKLLKAVRKGHDSKRRLVNDAF
jgi:hypothetical protein